MTSSDNEIHDPVVIMSHIRSFYSSLYKRRSSKNKKECLEYLRSFNLPQISSCECESCEGLLTRKECWEALQSMKNGKSPENDGLTKEFYVSFFNEISPLLIDVLNHSYQTGQLSTPQCQALTTLIEKEEKDKRCIKNWRPISLINVDAKLASKVLAGRIKKVLPNIIKHDQTAYVTGSYIGESIRLMSDILEYTEENNIDGILFSADFEKSFDSVVHSFILATLQSFGFGPQFIHWVRVILNKAESCVMNNGHSTGYFPLERGCRQGDPLSAYLFIICVEVLFIQVRENDDIIGIKIDDREIKLSAFADDADFLVANVMSLKLIFDICSRFQSYSSLKLNLEKSEAYWIGRARGSNNTPISCKWVDLNNQAVRTLGIFNSYDQDLVQKLNFLCNLKCLSEVLQLWRGRGLSLSGKILVFKTLALSRLLYACTTKIPSKQLIDQLYVFHKNFIWDKKRPKIKHSTLIADFLERDYKDIDIKSKISSMKFSWRTRLLDSNFHPWKIIPNKLFTVFGGLKIIFYPNLQLSKRCSKNVDNIPDFYKELVYLWQDISSKKTEDALDISNEVLWNNRHVTRDGNSLYDESLIDKGIITIRDISNEIGELLSWSEAEQKFSLNRGQILNWLGLLNCVPKDWKNKLAANSERLYSAPANLNTKQMPFITSKTAYQILLKSLVRPATAQSSLESSLHLTNVDWKKVYMLPRLTTIESSLRSFQYKILNNVMFLNERLHKFNVVTSPLCSLCKEKNESVSHLFCYCRETRSCGISCKNSSLITATYHI